jgi:hypothetical protein
MRPLKLFIYAFLSFLITSGSFVASANDLLIPDEFNDCSYVTRQIEKFCNSPSPQIEERCNSLYQIEEFCNSLSLSPEIEEFGNSLSLSPEIEEFGNSLSPSPDIVECVENAVSIYELEECRNLLQR